MILFQKVFHIIICSCNAAIANEWRLDLCNQEKSSFLTTYYVHTVFVGPTIFEELQNLEGGSRNDCNPLLLQHCSYTNEWRLNQEKSSFLTT